MSLNFTAGNFIFVLSGRKLNGEFVSEHSRFYPLQTLSSLPVLVVTLRRFQATIKSQYEARCASVSRGSATYARLLSKLGQFYFPGSCLEKSAELKSSQNLHIFSDRAALHFGSSLFVLIVYLIAGRVGLKVGLSPNNLQSRGVPCVPFVGTLTGPVAVCNHKLAHYQHFSLQFSAVVQTWPTNGFINCSYHT